MGKWEFVMGGRTRRALVGAEAKVKALADIYIRGRDAKEVMAPLYEAAGKDLPKSISIILANWKKSIMDKLDKDDPYTIQLCQDAGLIREKSSVNEEDYEEQPKKPGRPKAK